MRERLRGSGIRVESLPSLAVDFLCIRVRIMSSSESEEMLKGTC